MRINHNISALKANNQLARTNKLLDGSLERLSSGFRINSAADDSAGLAISEKMRTQISGLEQASRNASDGISVIQTAEGALVEVEAMLQRMRELAVQSANGIYTTDDRVAIQAEIDQLNEEITRISETTEFNTMTLLDGNIDRKSYSSDNRVSLISLSDTVSVGEYGINIIQDARQAVIVGQRTNFTTGVPTTEVFITEDQAGSINVNGESIVVKAGDSLDQVFEKLRDACDNVDVNVFAVDSDAVFGDPLATPVVLPTLPVTGDNFDLAGYESKQLEAGDTLVFTSRDYGSKEKLEIHVDNDDLSALLGLTIEGAKAEGIDAKATLTYKSVDPDSLFENTATVSVNGNKVTVSDRNDFNMVFEVKPGTVGTLFDDFQINVNNDGNPVASPNNDVDSDPSTDNSVAITVSVLDAGPMDLQIGANEGQIMSVRIPRVTPETLGVDKINIGTADGAQEAITLLDTAINMVSAIRSKLGAYQNRLEHSISNLDVTGENMTESLSRIEDADMAEEMADYTQKNVLAQAGTSMLAQANQRPQTILSLLQQ
ncbi:flagellar biosynthesis protein FlgL [Mobilitalea sibirica]|uniref:Flagellin n=1 Tax=Mobilitalea sibirica TaxID=1462919 RepID=A0A8J7H2J0_9FIRM|nr:flagellin [Mobilitalea sibirica]MBH1941008.1 flagellar biosynthesis protein FlgL [Mobilitalea sibirica]